MKPVLFALAVLAATSSLRAADSDGAWATTADFTYATKYVLRGVAQAGASVQPAVETTSGPVAIGLWANQPMAGRAGHEVDFYASYTPALSDAWNLSSGGTLYFYPELPAGSGAKHAAIEPYAGVTGSVGGFSPGLFAYYDLTREAFTAQAQLGYSVPLMALGVSLDFSAALGRADPKTGAGYTYWTCGMSIPVKVSARRTVTLGVNYARNDLAAASKGNLQGTVGLAFSF